MEESMKVTGKEESSNVHVPKKRPPRKLPMDNVPFIQEAQKQMSEMHAPFLKIYRHASEVSVQKMCEDCGISHGTWENLEKGVDTKRSTHLVYMDHLFKNSERVYCYPNLFKKIILARLNDEYVFAQRISKDAPDLPPMSECIFGYPGDSTDLNEDETNQIIKYLQELIALQSAKMEAEENRMKEEVKRLKAEQKRMKAEIKRMKAEEKRKA